MKSDRAGFIELEIVLTSGGRGLWLGDRIGGMIA